MRKKLTALLSALMLFCGVSPAFADSAVNAYREKSAVTVMSEELPSEPSKSAKGIFVFFDSDGRLCGSRMSESSGGGFTAEVIESCKAIRLWITDGGGLHVLRETAMPDPASSPVVTSSPVATSTPAPAPVPSPAVTPAPKASAIESSGESSSGGSSVSRSVKGSSETEPVPTVLPVETPEASDAPEDLPPADSESKKADVCTMLVECKTAIAHEGLNEEILSGLPSDGIIIPRTETELTEGMTIYDVLMLLSDEYAVDIDGDDNYISGINGLSEFDCGPLSGWMYTVNGEFPQVSVGMYELKNGDRVEIRYSCNIGKDL